MVCTNHKLYLLQIKLPNSKKLYQIWFLCNLKKTRTLKTKSFIMHNYCGTPAIIIMISTFFFICHKNSLTISKISKFIKALGTHWRENNLVSIVILMRMSRTCILFYKLFIHASPWIRLNWALRGFFIIFYSLFYFRLNVPLTWRKST